ncbi:MAG: AAA family ATPase [Acidobacteria bacterium]|nr:AAA family ATPase [Acidobacteriota bacterium]
MSDHTPDAASPAPFQLQIISPFSTFQDDGSAAPTEFIVDGLLTAGGLSVIGAKPKVGKSSLSRHLAVCVASGTPFLGRDTTQGEVMLISLEDPRSHVDNCLGALGYNPREHSSIHIVERVSHDRQETVQAIRAELIKRPDVKLVIVDHLAPFLNIVDLSEYMPTLRGITLLRDLARDFPKVHILCLAHAKKVRCDDPFDTILGSTALRGAPDTNIVLMNERGHRVIVSETRVGRAIPATILDTRMVVSAGSDVAQGYSLGAGFDQWNTDRNDRAEKKQANVYTRRVVDYLVDCDKRTASHRDVVKHVTGKTERIVEAINSLEAEEIVTASGTPRQLRLNLDEDALKLFRLGK